MKFVVISAVVLFASLGCNSYPRYKTGPPVTPEEKSSEKTGLTTDEFIRFGRILQKYLGRPYKGNSKYRQGMDCSMFTYQVFRDFNRTYLPLKASEQYREGVEVPRTRLRFGDLVFFKTDRSGRITHVGIYVGDKDFIHSSSSNGVIISGMSEAYWAKRYAGARRILK